LVSVKQKDCRATSTLASNRLKTDLLDFGAAVSVGSSSGCAIAQIRKEIRALFDLPFPRNALQA